MRLKKISVENLFGIYKYELNLIEQSQSPVTIIHAPNGMGKTTLLKMIQAVIEGDIIYIDSIPFAKFRLDFEEGSYIEVCKVNIDESILNNSFAQLRSKLLHLSNQNMNEDSVIFDNILYVVNGKTFKTELRKDFISLLVRRTRLNHSESSEDITFADLIGDGENVYYNNDDVFVMDDLSVALSDLSKNFNVYFIKGSVTHID